MLQKPNNLEETQADRVWQTINSASTEGGGGAEKKTRAQHRGLCPSSASCLSGQEWARQGSNL